MSPWNISNIFVFKLDFSKKIVNNKNSFIIIIDFRYLLKYWKSPYMGEWKNNNKQ